MLAIAGRLVLTSPRQAGSTQCDIDHIRGFEPVLALLHQTANQPVWQA